MVDDALRIIGTEFNTGTSQGFCGSVPWLMDPPIRQLFQFRHPATHISSFRIEFLPLVRRIEDAKKKGLRPHRIRPSTANPGCCWRGRRRPRCPRTNGSLPASQSAGPSPRKMRQSCARDCASIPSPRVRASRHRQSGIRSCLVATPTSHQDSSANENAKIPPAKADPPYAENDKEDDAQIPASPPRPGTDCFATSIPIARLFPPCAATHARSAVVPVPRNAGAETIAKSRWSPECHDRSRSRQRHSSQTD